MLIAQTPYDLVNGAGPLVCAIVWFTALADRRAWLRASLVASVFVAVMFRRMSQASLNSGEVHDALLMLSGHNTLSVIDMVWTIAGLLMLKPLPTEVRSPDARHGGFTLGSVVAVWSDWTGRRSGAAHAGQGSEVLGQCLADSQPGAADARCDRGTADQEYPSLVRAADPVEGRGDRAAARREHPAAVATAIAIIGVVLACSAGYNVHLIVKSDRWEREAESANLAAMRIAAAALEQTP